MQPQEVKDVLDLDRILESPEHSHTPEGKSSLIAALIDWKNEGQFDINLTAGSVGPSEATVTPRSKRGKATEAGPEYGPDDEPGF